MSLLGTTAARILSVTNVIVSTIAFLLLISGAEDEKIAVLFGIDVDEFMHHEGLGDGNGTTTIIDRHAFHAWCVTYAMFDTYANIILAMSTINLSSWATIPWFIVKLINLVAQLTGFLFYITQDFTLDIRVIIMAVYNFVFTLGSIYIVYNAAMTWPDGILRKIIHRITYQRLQEEGGEELENRENEQEPAIAPQPQGSVADNQHTESVPEAAAEGVSEEGATAAIQGTDVKFTALKETEGGAVGSENDEMGSSSTLAADEKYSL
ncbi:uncharacterized protein [Periplaneta americana]|uniref:uncharacterized protein n=1 Tax=Periplaneta americana TaxID=6978 RepID=UPI0037E7B80A